MLLYLHTLTYLTFLTGEKKMNESQIIIEIARLTEELSRQIQSDDSTLRQIDRLTRELADIRYTK